MTSSKVEVGSKFNIKKGQASLMMDNIRQQHEGAESGLAIHELLTKSRVKHHSNFELSRSSNSKSTILCLHVPQDVAGMH